MCLKCLTTQLWFFFLFCLPAYCWAAVFQTVSISSSPNPVGSGARALGMGGAFIAIADDATAASWNPAGLVQLERPEISVVGASIIRHSDDYFSKNPEADTTTDLRDTNTNYLSLAYPFRLKGYNMVLALNYQHLYNFSQDINFSYNTSSNIISGTVNVDNSQEGDLAAYGLAYGVRLTPELSFGLTLNFWQDGLTNNGWVEKRRDTLQAIFNANGQPVSATLETTDNYEFSGFNYNLGLLYRFNESFTLGAILKTSFTADLIHTSSWQDTTVNPPPLSPLSFGVGPTVTDENLDMPRSYGVGLAWRFSDTFTAAFDLYRTEWDDYILRNDTQTVSPLTGLAQEVSYIDPTIQVRLGGEYLLMTERYIIPIRAGIFYDPAPAPHSPDDYYGISLGSGWIRDTFMIDAAYQYRFGRDVGDTNMQALGYKKDVDEHTFYLSMIVYL